MAKEKDWDLTTLRGFTAGVRDAAIQADRGESTGIGSIHCPTCGGPRRVDVARVHVEGGLLDIGGSWSDQTGHVRSATANGPLPTSVFHLFCRQCRTRATAIVYEGPSGPDLVILWSHLGGLRTPHTPDGAAYYLDQAARAESVGARSAAVTMYRAACEQVLLEQGYTARMLGPKLGQLDAAKRAGTAPRWATDLHADYLEVLKNLGNAATHAGDGDVTKQDELDSALLADVRIVVERLLESIYEQPLRDAGLLDRLRSKAAKVT